MMSLVGFALVISGDKNNINYKRQTAPEKVKAVLIPHFEIICNHQNEQITEVLISCLALIVTTKINEKHKYVNPKGEVGNCSLCSWRRLILCVQQPLCISS